MPERGETSSMSFADFKAGANKKISEHGVPPPMSDEESRERVAEAKKILGENFETEADKEMPRERQEILAYARNDGLLKYIFEDISDEDLWKVLEDPKEFSESLKLDEYDILDIQDWFTEVKKEMAENWETFEEIKKRNPGNPLFKENLEKKEGFVSVFHYTGESSLSGIGEKGLKPAKSARPADQVFDQYAPERFKRMDAVYAYYDYHRKDNFGGNIILETQVDPDKALVADAELFTEAVLGSGNGKEVDVDYVKSYWEKAVTLSEYLKLSKEEQARKFTHPEVIIPEGIEPEEIRAVGCRFII